jgi:hypothetical protein
VTTPEALSKIELNYSLVISFVGRSNAFSDLNGIATFDWFCPIQR